MKIRCWWGNQEAWRSIIELEIIWASSVYKVTNKEWSICKTNISYLHVKKN